MEFELAYYNAAVQHVSHYVTGTPFTDGTKRTTIIDVIVKRKQQCEKNNKLGFCNGINRTTIFYKVQTLAFNNLRRLICHETKKKQ